MWQAALELKLNNIQIIKSRVENYLSLDLDCIVSRAFSDLNLFGQNTLHLLKHNKHKDIEIFAMKGRLSAEELQAVTSPLVIKNIIKLNLKFLDAERHLVIMGLE